MHETITRTWNHSTLSPWSLWASSTIEATVVNIVPEVTVTAEKEWAYTKEEEAVSVEREEEYEEYDEYDYKEFEEYEPTEEYDQYEEYEEREFEHYEEYKEHEEYVTGMSRTLHHIKYMQMTLGQDKILNTQRNLKRALFCLGNSEFSFLDNF